MPATTSPAWMRQVLLAAAGYNLLWGAWAVLFPDLAFEWAGMEPPRYPQLWQCVGMIVGVYGIGYACAAWDPVRHWPVVLVGFLGKVLGPLGMVQALWTGALPWTFGLNCVTNDLIWWVPFALILRHAWIHFVEDREGGERLPLKVMLDETSLHDGRSLAELGREGPMVLVCLRHTGCTFAQETLLDLAGQVDDLHKKGTRMVLVHMHPSATAFEAVVKKAGVGNVAMVQDPERRVYRALGLRRARLRDLLRMEVWVRGWHAFFSKGCAVGGLQGDGMQMPGVFLVKGGRVVKSWIAELPSDVPDWQAVGRAAEEIAVP